MTETKLEMLANDIAYLFNRGTGQLSADSQLWIVAERVLFAYPLKVQRALLVLLMGEVNGTVILNPVAREKLVGYLTDEVNVWGEE